MKTYPKYFRVANQNFLIVLIVLFTVLGMSLKLKAQDPVLGNDYELVNNSMKIKMSKHDFDILVPKVEINTLSTYSEVYFNQLVYVTDKNPGFYMFTNNQWVKQSVSELLTQIDLNLDLSVPRLADMVLVSDENNRHLLDYNGHISHLYADFSFEEGSNQMAISL